MRSFRSVGLTLTATIVLAVVAPSVAMGDHTLVMRPGPEGARTELLLNGAVVGTLHSDGGRIRLETDRVVAVVQRSEEPLQAGRPYPRRVSTLGRLAPSGASARDEYTLLAPPSPIEIEGLGLVVSDDSPGQNDEEHERLRAWLSAGGLEADTAIFEETHRRDTGRELVVWYEIAGRRVDGALFLDGSTTPAARYDSLFHTEGDGFKIHHARGPFYHRKSLELVDVVAPAEGPAMRAYQCGCYQWAIGADWVTLGDRLFHVTVEWAHHRVGAGLFLGFEGRDGFPFFGLGDRDRMGRRGRRALAYQFKDAREELLGEIRMGLPRDPPARGLGSVTYDIRLVGASGALERLGVAGHRDGELTLELVGADVDESLERLDQLLAIMPTQVIRGDGLRDSHVGMIETMVDWFRLLRRADGARLADVVSDADLSGAVAKATALLDGFGDRFAPGDAHVPPMPARGPRSPFGAG